MTFTVDFETEAIDGCPIMNPPKPIGVSVKENYGISRYYDRWEDMERVIRDIWSREDSIVFQNAPFDLSVAHKWLRVSHPKWNRIHDTKLMIYLHDPHAKNLSLKPSAERILGWDISAKDELKAWILENVEESRARTWGAFICRAPSWRVAKYANQDTAMTWAMFEHLRETIPMEAYQTERELQYHLTNATRKGIRVDRDRLITDAAACSNSLEEAEARVHEILGRTFDTTNPTQLADALDAAGKITEWKYTPTGRRSTKRENLIAGVADKELLTLLQYVGLMQTCLGTFMLPWIKLAHGTGRLHPSWNQVRGDNDYGTRTGRLSCSKPNLQNVPNVLGVKTPPGLRSLPAMRDYLLPEEGEVWASRDFSAQEMRLLAHFEDGELMEAFQRDPSLDPHEMVQALILDKTGLELTRKQVKGIGFGLIYGMGVTGVSKRLAVTKMEADRMIRAYHLALPGVALLQRGTKSRGRCRQAVTTIGGRDYFAEAPKIVGNEIRSFEYKLLNYLIQGSAADQTKRALIRYFRAKPVNQTFLLTVHDQIDVSLPPGYNTSVLREAMEDDTDMGLDVPIKSTLAIGPTWGSITDVED